MRTITQEGNIFISMIIVLSLAGVLVVIALPSYQTQSRQAFYEEIVDSTTAYRSAVNECAHNLGTLEGCNSGSYAIPPAIIGPEGAVASLQVTNGVITVVPVASHKILSTDTYILTPTLKEQGKIVAWASSGGGVEKGYFN